MLRAAAAVLVCLAAVSVGFRQVADWDFWWQIRVAHDAWTYRSVLPVDAMSHSVVGAAWPHKDLVGYLPLWWAWEVGPVALNLLLGLVVAVGAVALWFVVPRAQRDPLVWLLAANAWIAAVESRVMPRALVFSITAFVVMLVLIEHARLRAHSWRALVPWMVALAVLEGVWMNLHRGGIHGVVLLVGFTGWCVLGAVAARHARLGPLLGPPAHPASIGVAAFGTALAIGLGALNPSGWAVYTTGFRVSYDAVHRTRITEWLPLSPELALSTYPVATGLALLAPLVVGAALVAAMRSGRRGPVDVWHLGVMAVFAYQGQASARWMTDAASAAIVPLLLVAAAAAASARVRGAWRDAPLVLLLAGLALPVAANGINHQRLGAGLEAGRFPDQAIAYARRNGLGSDVHNAFVYGGYVLWEGRDPQQPLRALIDGRNDMVYPSTFYARCVDAQRDPALFAALQREYPSDWVLADNTPGRETFTFLGDDPEWALVFWSEPATVWVRRDRHAGVARADRFEVLRPGAEIPSLLAGLQAAGPDPTALGHIAAELDRIATATGPTFRTLTLQALFWHAMTNIDAHAAERRDAVATTLEVLHPDHPALPTVLRALSQPPPSLVGPPVNHD